MVPWPVTKVCTNCIRRIKTLFPVRRQLWRTIGSILQITVHNALAFESWSHTISAILLHTAWVCVHLSVLCSVHWPQVLKPQASSQQFNAESGSVIQLPPLFISSWQQCTNPPGSSLTEFSSLICSVHGSCACLHVDSEFRWSVLLFMAAVLVYMLIQNSELLFMAAVLVLHEVWWATWKHPWDHPMGHGARTPYALHLHGAKTAGPSEEMALPWDETTEPEKRRWTSLLLCQTVTAQHLCSVFQLGATCC
jgi:hypothetical protein